VTATITNIEVRGQKVAVYNKEEFTAQNTLSVNLYGRQEYTHNYNLLDDSTYAQSLADYELVQRKDPRGVVKNLTLNQRQRDFIINRTIGDYIRVIDDQTEHDAEYVVWQERHTWRTGDVHECDYVLKPTSGLDYMIYDTHEYDDNKNYGL
jgi:hypothetical protein